MKLKSKNNNSKKLPIIIMAAIIVVAALVVGGIFLSRTIKEGEADKQNQEIQGISISVIPKIEYYIGDSFDPTGLKIQVIAGANEYSYYVTYPNSELQISGFDSSVANEALPITVSYKGFTKTFNVTIKEHEPESPYLVSIEAKDLNTTYDLTTWNVSGPDYNNAYLLCTYSDGSTENVWIQNEWATEREILKAPGKTNITIEYMGKSIVVEFTITK